MRNDSWVYVIRRKETDQSTQVRAEAVDELFEVIERVTGLDRLMAETILQSGNAIETPTLRIEATHVE
jgi:hypothetical protein